MTLDELLELKPANAPQIVTLCGSTSRALQAFQDANLQLTLQGFIVLSIGCNTHDDTTLKIDQETKNRLDVLHLHKIDLADIVFILNPNGYIGESTAREIEYANRIGKPIYYLEPIEEKPE